MLTIQQIARIDSFGTGATETALAGLLVKGPARQTKDSTGVSTTSGPKMVKQIRKRGQVKQTRED